MSAVDSENRGGAGIFLLGGILSYLLHRESQKNRLHCRRCDFVFAAPRTASPARIITTTLFLLLVAAAALYFAYKFSAEAFAQ